MIYLNLLLACGTLILAFATIIIAIYTKKNVKALEEASKMSFYSTLINIRIMYSKEIGAIEHKSEGFREKILDILSKKLPKQKEDIEHILFYPYKSKNKNSSK